jgi:hypothetical protein
MTDGKFVMQMAFISDTIDEWVALQRTDPLTTPDLGQVAINAAHKTNDPEVFLGMFLATAISKLAAVDA